jgi:periplasmic protein TonB
MTGLTIRQAALLVTAAHLLVLSALLAAGLLQEATPPRVIQVSLQPLAQPQATNRLPTPSPPTPRVSTATSPAPATPAKAAPPTTVAPVTPQTPAAAIAPTPASSPTAPAAASTPGGRSSDAPDATETNRNANNPAGAPRAATDDRQPTIDASYRGNPLPVYPAMSRRLGEQGVVVLRVLIDANGRAVDVQIQRSSGSGRLDQAALEAIREWRFVPARRGGKPVPEWYEWRWEFRLNG